MRKAAYKSRTPDGSDDDGDASERSLDHSPVRAQNMAERPPKLHQPLKVHNPRKLPNPPADKNPIARLGEKVLAANREPPRSARTRPTREEVEPIRDRRAGFVHLKSGKTILYETLALKYYTVNPAGNKRYVTDRINLGTLKVFSE